MSKENVEIVRQSFDAWNRNDWKALERFYDPAIEGIGPEEWPETGILRGWEEVRIQFARNKESWEEEHVEIDEIDEVGPDRVLVQIRWVTKGKESGITFESPVSILFTVRRKIMRIEYYFDHAEALKAAGLPE